MLSDLLNNELNGVGLAMTIWLADKSALARLSQSPDAPLWAERIEHGLLSICTVTRLKVRQSLPVVANPCKVGFCPTVRME